MGNARHRADKSSDTYLDYDTKFGKRRAREKVVKNIFGTIEGISWGVGLASILLVTGVATLGVGFLIIFPVMGGLAGIGGAIGLFRANDHAEEKNKTERKLVDAFNKKLIEEQKLQMRMVEEIKATHAAFMKQLVIWDALLASDKKWDQLTPAEQSAVTLIAQTAQALTIAIGKLRPIKEIPVEKLQSSELNSTIQDLKINPAYLAKYDSVLNKDLLKSVLPPQPPEPAPSAPKELSTWGWVTEKIARLRDKVFSFGMGAGVAILIGSVVGVALLSSNPVGWVVGATLLGVAVGCLVVGGISMYIKQRANRSEKKSIVTLTENIQVVGNRMAAKEQHLATLRNNRVQMEYVPKEEHVKKVSEADAREVKLKAEMSAQAQLHVGKINQMQDEISQLNAKLKMLEESQAKNKNSNHPNVASNQTLFAAKKTVRSGSTSKPVVENKKVDKSTAALDLAAPIPRTTKTK